MSIQVVSAEDQIEKIIEQARIVERKSVNRLAFLQDVSALYLLGLRHLAREIDELVDSLGVVTDFVPPPSIEVPAVEPPDFAAQLAELTLQVTRMTKAVERRSEDLENRSNELERRSEDLENRSNELERRSEDLENRSNELERRSEDLKEQHSKDFKKLSKKRRKK